MYLFKYDIYIIFISIIMILFLYVHYHNTVKTVCHSKIFVTAVKLEHSNTQSHPEFELWSLMTTTMLHTLPTASLYIYIYIYIYTHTHKGYSINQERYFL